MTQETDGSTLISLLWLACICWNIWYGLSHWPPADQEVPREVRDETPTWASSQDFGLAQLADRANRLSRCDIGAGDRPAVARALRDLQRQDRWFTLTGFLAGASATYEAIALAFAAGDRETLESAVSAEVYRTLLATIIDREGRGEKAETTFVRIAPPEIVDVALDEGHAQISVRFDAELYDVTRGPAGRVIHGDPGRSRRTAELWTFARSIHSPGPDWTLVATGPA